MTDAHERVLNTLDAHPNPAVSRLDLVGQAAGPDADSVDIFKAVEDLLGDGSLAGQQLVAMERGGQTWIVEKDADAVAGANAWLKTGGYDAE